MLAVSLALVLGGCAARGSVEDTAAGDAATAFLAAASSAPEGACDLLAPATLEELRSVGDDCAGALGEVAPEGGPSGTEPTVEVYGRDAMVRWGATTLFLARFDEGWLVTAAGCEPRGKDLPYDCSVEGR
ncbi:hypothetical protein ACOCJ4_14280 [Knoellia sp. CPCC 206435]|uniref:hypothetical protein n=1 Tax=Knoellia terrae TaxID=3404797 RepID=UPI003B438CD7